jgi:hypothetical protein
MKRSISHIALAAITLGSCIANLASAATISGSSPSWTAETNTAPALANFNAGVVAAWKGQSGNTIWYSYGPDWEQQHSVSGALTTQAPALTATPSTIYLAWRGQSTGATDHIYYSTSTGSSFSAQTKVCDGLGSCPETTSSPALAANGSTIYMVWTTSSNTILLGTYSGSGDWSLSSTPVPGATTAIAPALTVYGSSLYLAWVDSSDNLMYATFSLSSSSWSPAAPVSGSTWTAQTSVAPAFGISPVPEHTGLYLAWTAPSSTEGEFTVNLSQLEGSSWNPPLPIPPGPLAVANLSPALVGYVGGSNNCGQASVYSFNLAYTTTGEDIEWSNLQSDTILHKCTCPCPTCCT